MTNKIPQDRDEWESIIAARELDQKSIHTFQRASSASGISYEQYLLLQVTWRADDKDNAIVDLLDEDNGKWAKGVLANKPDNPAWCQYWSSIDNVKTIPHGRFEDIGRMSLVLYYQLLCFDTRHSAIDTPKIGMVTRSQSEALRREQQQSPTPRGQDIFDMNEEFSEDENENEGGEEQDDDDEDDVQDIVHLQLDKLNLKKKAIELSTPPGSISKGAPLYSPVTSSILYPRSDDEQIINTALILYLTSLVLFFDISAEWSMYRKSFHLGGRKKKDKIFQACVDGYLWTDNKDEARIIVEVKPFLRFENLKIIQMQEAAQMAAWICSQPKNHKVVRDGFRFV